MAGPPKYAKKRARFEEDDEGGADAPTTSSSGPAAKKAKGSGEAATAELGSGKDADGNPYWDLSSRRRVGISTFKGKLLVNIREYYEQNGELKPGKKGISLSVEQYQALLKAAPAINAELRSQGEDVADPYGAADEGGAAPADADAGGAPLVPAKKAKAKAAPKKANIEATSDEDSD